MRLGDYRWVKNDSGDYVVTNKRTGRSVTATLQAGNPKRYRIHESDETEVNHDGRTIPKRYDFWGVMAFCAGRKPGAKIDTPTREGFSHA